MLFFIYSAAVGHYVCVSVSSLKMKEEAQRTNSSMARRRLLDRKLTKVNESDEVELL